MPEHWMYFDFLEGSRKMEGRYCLVFIFSIIQSVHAQQGFISLDCGSPTKESPYIEPVTGLVFSSDAEHIQSGKSGRIQKNLETLHIKPYLFLRYFPDGVRNCYTLDVLQNINYLIKAVFVYGNYDGFDDYPSFDLYLGPNKWGRVNLEGKVNGTVEEIIHIPRSNALQICLVRTGNSVPFISALELRLLRNDTYIGQDVSLKHLFRRYHRRSDRLIRYPDDVFDRIWSPFFLPEWTQLTTSFDVNNSNNYEPPKAALKSAAIPRDNGTQLTINWTLDNPNEQVHLYFHFAELEPVVYNGSDLALAAAAALFRTRIFSILVNGNVTSDSVVLLDLAVSTVDTVVKKCDGGKCTLQLVQSKRSIVPPLLNAMEAFTAIKFPNSETNPDDVVSIKIIQDVYGLNKIDWQGDPCSPQQFLWGGINCSYMNMSTSPRIISLDLSSHGLTGKIVPQIQNLTQLQVLDLSNNKLTGGVPEFLANMKSLLFINLSNNNLDGSIPRALLDRENLKLDVEGNPKLCVLEPCKSSAGNKEIKIIVPVATAVAIFIVVSVLIIVFRKKRPASIRALHSAPANLSLEVKRRISYSEIQLMTNNFERVIGEGGFGVVYHAYLDDRQQMAVKVLSPSSSQGYKQFKAEVDLLLRVHHTNLVSLVGYCDEQTHLALIYEYMANGDLKSHLSGKYGQCVLNWANRLRIAVETALGLEYLHSGCKPPMVHRDVKSVNILLDEHLQAKLADFGLSRSFSIGDETHVSTVVVGTPGYLDPEYYKTHRLTEKSDVYSFGIVLLEIITNQPVIEQANEYPHIAERVGTMLTRGDIRTIVDPDLHEEYDSGSVWKALELAMSCVNPSPVARPDMSHVVHELKECMKSENLRAGLSQVMDSKSSLEEDTSFDSGMTPDAR